MEIHSILGIRDLLLKGKEEIYTCSADLAGLIGNGKQSYRHHVEVPFTAPMAALEAVQRRTAVTVVKCKGCSIILSVQ